MKPGWFGLPSGPDLTPAQATLPARLAFVSVAVWWVVFSIPLFRTVPEPPVDGRAPSADAAGNPVVAAFVRLARDVPRAEAVQAGVPDAPGVPDLQRRDRHDHPDGDDLRRRDRLDQGAMIAALVLVQFVGIPFAFVFGGLAGGSARSGRSCSRWPSTRGSASSARFMTTSTHFFMLAVLVGMVQGGSQALSRSLFASLIPRDRSGEFFGFFAVVEKFAGIFGPLLFAAEQQARRVEPARDPLGDRLLRRRRPCCCDGRRRGRSARGAGEVEAEVVGTPVVGASAGPEPVPDAHRPRRPHVERREEQRRQRDRPDRAARRRPQDAVVGQAVQDPAEHRRPSRRPGRCARRSAGPAARGRGSGSARTSAGRA